MTLNRPLASLLAVATVLASCAASAATAGTSTETTHWTEVPFETPDSDCSGERVTLSGLSSGVVHVTERDSGDFHLTLTELVSFTAVRGAETFTGRWTATGGLNLNNQNAASTSTFAAIGRTDTGAELRLHVTEHFSASATGVARVFDKVICID